MTTSEAAEILDVDPSRVRQLCRSGQLKAKKVGRDWLLKRTDVQRFAKSPPGRPGKPRSL